MSRTTLRDKLFDQLVLDAPIISTRRSSSSTSPNCNKLTSCKSSRRISSSDSKLRIPFSWESSPGVPKHQFQLHDNDHEEEPFPLPPKPPPCKWLPPKENNNENENIYEDGNEGDIENYYNDGSDSDDEFSDALDTISLSEKFNVACRLSSFDNAAAKEIKPIVCKSPSFIMNRFLPAANAIASTSTANNHTKNSTRRPANTSNYAPHHKQKEGRRSHVRQHSNLNKFQIPLAPYLETRSNELSPKACGLMVFFPWSLKPTVCGFKYTNGTRNIRANLKPPHNHASSTTTIRSSAKDCGWSSEAEDDIIGNFFGPQVKTKAPQSPSWGLPFLDTQRLRLRGKDVDKWKEKAREKSESNVTERNKNRRSSSWSLPHLVPPSESWLSHAFNSINRKG